MNSLLLTKLIERGIVAAMTEIDATYRGKDIGGQPTVATTGTFLIRKIVPTDTGYLFEAANVIDGRSHVIPSSAVLKIDGMEPKRLAGIYGLSETGEPIRQGKRRGRKPKALQEAQECTMDHTPNETTIEAIREAEAGMTVRFETMEDLMADLDEDEDDDEDAL